MEGHGRIFAAFSLPRNPQSKILAQNQSSAAICEDNRRSGKIAAAGSGLDDSGRQGTTAPYSLDEQGDR